MAKLHPLHSRMLFIVLLSVILSKLLISGGLELIPLLPCKIGFLLVLKPLLIEESKLFQVLFLCIRDLVGIRVLVHQELLKDLFCPKDRGSSRAC